MRIELKLAGRIRNQANVQVDIWEHAPGALIVPTVDLQTGEWIVPGSTHRARLHHKNMIVTAGLNHLRDLLADASPPTRMTHGAVGTDNTAAVLGDTTLMAEVYRNVITQRVKSSAQLVWKFFVASTAANGSTLKEAGLFNAASAGTMLTRIVTSNIVKTSSVTVTYTWTHVLSGA